MAVLGLGKGAGAERLEPLAYGFGDARSFAQPCGVREW
jgi:hypothetical protein